MLRRLGFSGGDDPNPFRGELSGRKKVTWSASIPLERVTAAGRASSATVNDLALTAIAGALRRYLEGDGHPVGRFTAGVPVNLRPKDRPLDPGSGNEFGFALVRLPVEETSVLTRLAAVKAAMGQVKAAGEGSRPQRPQGDGTQPRPARAGATGALRRMGQRRHHQHRRPPEPLQLRASGCLGSPHGSPRPERSVSASASAATRAPCSSASPLTTP